MKIKKLTILFLYKNQIIHESVYDLRAPGRKESRNIKNIYFQKYEGLVKSGF